MPTYQYECSDCGHEFEILQSMRDKKLTKCPRCDKKTLHRLIGQGGGIIFKGSGFYETDYKKKEPATCAASTTDKKDAKPECATCPMQNNS